MIVNLLQCYMENSQVGVRASGMLLGWYKHAHLAIRPEVRLSNFKPLTSHIVPQVPVDHTCKKYIFPHYIIINISPWMVRSVKPKHAGNGP